MPRGWGQAYEVGLLSHSRLGFWLRVRFRCLSSCEGKTLVRRGAAFHDVLGADYLLGGLGHLIPIPYTHHKVRILARVGL